MFCVDRAFLWKLILVNKWDFVYRLNNIRLKETHCACASKQVCRSLYHVYLRHALVLWYGHQVLAVYNKSKTEYHLCTKFKFYAHAQQLKNQKGINYKQLTSVLLHFIILQPTWSLLESPDLWKLYDNSLKSENALRMCSRHFPMWFYILFCLVSHGL